MLSKKICWLGLILLVLAGWPVRSARAQDDDWPTDGWRTSSPEQQGMDSGLLADAVEYLRQQNQYDVHSLLVIRNGTIVADAAFYPYQAGGLHDLASVTKSFTATLIGRAIQEGFLTGVDQRVVDFFPDRTIAHLDADKQVMTIEDLLTMRSGFACGLAFGERELYLMIAAPDWVQFTLDLPVVSPPGTKWAYCSPGAHLLQAILAQATRMSTMDFASQYLFEPLGILEVVWPVGPAEIVHGWGDLRLTPHDMAKLGYLYLHDGMWDGKQLLPAGWVTAATHPPAGSDTDFYGYLWWLDANGYSAQGRGGQIVQVIPDQQMIVVVTGNGGDDQAVFKQLLDEYLLPAAASSTPLPDNPAGVARLDAAIQEAAAALPTVEPVPVPPLPATAADIAGKTYLLDPNLLGVTELVLTFPTENTALVAITWSDLTCSWEIGLDGIARIAPGRYGLPAASKGGWKNEHTFAFEVDEIGNNFKWQFEALFNYDRMLLTAVNRADPFGAPIIITGQRE